jgi:hypothetical protein
VRGVVFFAWHEKMGLIGIIIILLMAGIGSSCLGSPSLSMEHSEARDDYIDVKNPNRNLAVFES